MGAENSTLEREVEQEYVVCCGCSKKIKSDKAWYSSNDLPYCNVECFLMFTED